MRAAVVDEVGGVPEYREIADPIVGEDQVLVEVEAVAVENVDRAVVAGTHFSAGPFIRSLPAVPCFDGIGRLPDGTLVGFGGLVPPHGTLAEYAVVPAGYTSPIPDGIPATTAAVLSSAISAMSMQTAGDLQEGETVLVQGATGVAGRLAVQIARLLGAGRVVATGRDAAALESLRALGADAVIDTAVPDEELVAAYRRERGEGYHVVLDYLWARPTELLARALVPEGFGFPPPTRLVQIGESAGSAIRLPADAVRTSGLEIYGAARNMATGMAAAYGRVVEWVRAGDLTFDVTVMPLSSIASAWQRTDLRGSRLVIVPDRITEERNPS
jgi:NADPH:quinone reductase-like Zn-dependent oxidoreductase